MNKIKNYFLFAAGFLVLLFLHASNASASSYSVNPNCTGPGIPGTTCTNSVTITLTAADKGVVLGANSFDDWGTLTVTRPSSASSSLSTPGGFGPKSLATGNIFGMFSEGPGVYTITVWAEDTGGAGMGANAIITVSTGPTCTLTVDPDLLISGSTVDPTVSWSTSNAISATLDGIAVTPVASGSKTFTGVTSATPYVFTATDSDGITSTCNAAIVVVIPPTGGLVPCARLVDNPATGDIDESKPCNICALFYMLKNITNFILDLAISAGVFILILCGLFYAFSSGNPGKIEKAKNIMGKTIGGIALVFIAWLIIAIILQALGYANISIWNQVNCTL